MIFSIKERELQSVARGDYLTQILELYFLLYNLFASFYLNHHFGTGFNLSEGIHVGIHILDFKFSHLQKRCLRL